MRRCSRIYRPLRGRNLLWCIERLISLSMRFRNRPAPATEHTRRKALRYRACRRKGKVAGADERVDFFYLLEREIRLPAAPLRSFLAVAQRGVKLAVVVFVYRQLFPAPQFYGLVFTFVLLAVRPVVILHPADCWQYDFALLAYQRAFCCHKLAGDFSETYRSVVFF